MRLVLPLFTANAFKFISLSLECSLKQSSYRRVKNIQSTLNKGGEGGYLRIFRQKDDHDRECMNLLTTKGYRMKAQTKREENNISSNQRKRFFNLEAFPVNDGRTSLIVLLLGDPHLLESRE